MNKNQKRILLPDLRNTHYKAISPDQVVTRPQESMVIEDALSTAANEIYRLRAKSDNGTGLDSKEIKDLLNLIDGIVTISKEKREIEKALQEEDLTDEELLEKLEEAKKATQARIAQKKKAKEGEDNEDQGNS